MPPAHSSTSSHHSVLTFAGAKQADIEVARSILRPDDVDSSKTKAFNFLASGPDRPTAVWKLRGADAKGADELLVLGYHHTFDKKAQTPGGYSKKTRKLIKLYLNVSKVPARTSKLYRIRRLVDADHLQALLPLRPGEELVTVQSESTGPTTTSKPNDSAQANELQRSRNTQNRQTQSQTTIKLKLNYYAVSFITTSELVKAPKLIVERETRRSFLRFRCLTPSSLTLGLTGYYPPLGCRSPQKNCCLRLLSGLNSVTTRFDLELNQGRHCIDTLRQNQSGEVSKLTHQRLVMKGSVENLNLVGGGGTREEDQNLSLNQQVLNSMQRQGTGLNHEKLRKHGYTTIETKLKLAESDSQKKAKAAQASWLFSSKNIDVDDLRGTKDILGLQTLAERWEVTKGTL